jgi:hypothetical protein
VFLLRNAECMVMVQQGIDYDGFDIRYRRRGYVDYGRTSDRILAEFILAFPSSNYLPDGWRHTGPESFVLRYGHMGVLLWAASASSHTLFYCGTPIIRIWTDAKKSCYVEAKSLVLTDFVIDIIPPKNTRKSAPFAHRVRLGNPHDATLILQRLKQVYGI